MVGRVMRFWTGSVKEKAAIPVSGAGLRRMLGLNGRQDAEAQAASAAADAESLAAYDDLDLRAIGQVLWRKRAWVIIPTIIAFVLAFVAVNMVTPRYKSEARIIIDGRENIFLRPNAERVEDRAQLDQEAVTSQVQLILSRDLARRVVAKEKLEDNPEFDPVLRGISPLKSVLSLFGIGRDPLKMTREERVLEAYYERLTAYAVDKSRVIAIEFQSRDPELAARVTNAVAEGYLLFQQSAKRQQARDASSWLSGEIESLRKKVAEAEQRVEEFRGKSNLIIGTNNTTLSSQQLGEINSQLASARAQMSDAEARARFIRNMLRTGQTIEASNVLNSELIRRLSEQRVTLRAQLAEQSSTLLGNHPRIKELRAQIFDLDRQIRDEAAKLAKSLETEAKIASARVDSLSSSLEGLKRQAVADSGEDVKLRALEREARSQRELLESYLTKYREASTRETIDAAPADARVISRAIVSNTPAYPKKLPIVLIATLATLMLSSGLIATGELLRQTAGRGKAAPAGRAGGPRAEDRLGAASDNVAFSVPDPAALALALADDIAADGTGSDRILLASVGRHLQPVAALSFARLLARRTNVVMVDLMSGVDESALASGSDVPGLYHLISGEGTFSRIVTKDQASPLHFVASGRGALADEVLQSTKTRMALDALARVYDHLLVSVGNLACVPTEISSRCQRAVLLIASDAEEVDLEAAQAALEAAGIARVDFLPGQAEMPQPGGGGRMMPIRNLAATLAA